MSKHDSIADAIAAVMASAGYVQKTGRNKQQGYNYASDADLLRAVQPAMSEAGLAMVPVRVDWTRAEVQTRSGGTMDKAECIVTYRLLHHSGEVDIQAAGCGTDTLDKAVYKAMTGAYKYAIRQMFAIPTGDDAEASASEAAPSRSPSQQTAPKPASHPNEWEAGPEGRAWFMARLRELGIDYVSDVKPHLAAKGWPECRTLPRQRLEGLLGVLAKELAPGGAA